MPRRSARTSTRRADPTPAPAAAPLASAGLRYSTDEEPGIRRRRAGKGFVYLNPDGSRVTDAETLLRIRSLAIPPAYEAVWICRSENGHLQATGMDARGRKQYRYHAAWRAVRDADKFDRMLDFGQALTRIHRRVGRDLRAPVLSRERVLATVVRLLETTLIRVGNEQYARENRSYGLTTLRERHVDVAGDVIRFEFRGKSGVYHKLAVQDRSAAAVVRRCLDLPGQELFQYRDMDGELRVVDSADVNEYLREAAGEAYTAKDFRTWYATMGVLETLASTEYANQREAQSHVKAALVDVARRLGNTPTMCRKCYVHPGVVQAYLAGELVKAGARGNERARSGRERLLQLLRRAQRRALASARDARPPQRSRRPRRPSLAGA